MKTRKKTVKGRPVTMSSTAVDGKAREFTQRAAQMYAAFSDADLKKLATNDSPTALVQQANQFISAIQRSVMNDIVSDQNPGGLKGNSAREKDRANRVEKIEFYVAVLKKTAESGNLAVAVPLLSAIKAFDNFQQTQEQLSTNAKEIIRHAQELLDKKNPYTLAIVASHAESKMVVIPSIPSFAGVATANNVKEKEKVALTSQDPKRTAAYMTAVSAAGLDFAALVTLKNKAATYAAANTDTLPPLSAPAEEEIHAKMAKLKTEEARLANASSITSQLNPDSEMTLDTPFKTHQELGAAKSKSQQQLAGIIGEIDKEIRAGSFKTKTERDLLLEKFTDVKTALHDGLGSKNRGQDNVSIKDYALVDAALAALANRANAADTSQQDAQALSALHNQLKAMMDQHRQIAAAYSEVVKTQAAELAKAAVLVSALGKDQLIANPVLSGISPDQQPAPAQPSQASSATAVVDKAAVLEYAKFNFDDVQENLAAASKILLSTHASELPPNPKSTDTAGAFNLDRMEARSFLANNLDLLKNDMTFANKYMQDILTQEPNAAENIKRINEFNRHVDVIAVAAAAANYQIDFRALKIAVPQAPAQVQAQAVEPVVVARAAPDNDKGKEEVEHTQPANKVKQGYDKDDVAAANAIRGNMADSMMEAMGSDNTAGQTIYNKMGGFDIPVTSKNIAVFHAHLEDAVHALTESEKKSLPESFHQAHQALRLVMGDRQVQVASIVEAAAAPVAKKAIELDKQNINKDNVNLPLDNEGNTALHLAVQQRNESLIKHILRMEGVDKNAKNIAGQTPKDIVVLRKSEVTEKNKSRISNIDKQLTASAIADRVIGLLDGTIPTKAKNAEKSGMQSELVKTNYPAAPPRNAADKFFGAMEFTSLIKNVLPMITNNQGKKSIINFADYAQVSLNTNLVRDDIDLDRNNMTKKDLPHSTAKMLNPLILINTGLDLAKIGACRLIDKALTDTGVNVHKSTTLASVLKAIVVAPLTAVQAVIHFPAKATNSVVVLAGKLINNLRQKAAAKNAGAEQTADSMLENSSSSKKSEFSNADLQRAMTKSNNIAPASNKAPDVAPKEAPAANTQSTPAVQPAINYPPPVPPKPERTPPTPFSTRLSKK